MSKKANNIISTLPPKVLQLIARTLRDSNATRLKSVSHKFKNGPIYAKSHPNMYKNARTNKVNNMGWSYGLAAMLLPPNRLPMKRVYYKGPGNYGEDVTYSTYFHPHTTRATGMIPKPYSRMRPIPKQRSDPFGNDKKSRKKPPSKPRSKRTLQ